MSGALQPAILAPLSPVARSLTLRVHQPSAVRGALARLAKAWTPEAGVVGIGEPCALALGVRLPGLRAFPAMAGPGCAVPSTQDALWLRLCGPDRGVVFDLARQAQRLLADAFLVSHALDTFVYHGGRDLTRFEDGTENPQGEDAVHAAAVADGALAGSSFVAVQQWVHDLDRFETMGEAARNAVIGRDAQTNEELDDAPESAHVKRTAQESFTPPAFMVRRSMPWAGLTEEGLEFVAFVATLDGFTQMHQRMTGREDGVVDALFSFSRPVTGGFYWCPPVVDGRLDLQALLAPRA